MTQTRVGLIQYKLPWSLSVRFTFFLDSRGSERKTVIVDANLVASTRLNLGRLKSRPLYLALGASRLSPVPGFQVD